MNEARHQISVIIPFYKGNRYLPDCLASLEAQGSAVGEVLFVVDKGSDPPVVPDDFSIPWGMIVNPEGANGAGLCRHYGYERVHYRYVMFLDPDDALLPGCLDAYLGEVQACSLVFAFARFYEVDGERSAVRPLGNFDGSLYGFLSKRYTVGCLTVMIDGCVFRRCRRTTSPGVTIASCGYRLLKPAWPPVTPGAPSPLMSDAIAATYGRCRITRFRRRCGSRAFWARRACRFDGGWRRLCCMRRRGCGGSEAGLSKTLDRSKSISGHVKR